MSDEIIRLGQGIRRFREALGYTQEEFADELGFERTKVGRMEKGEHITVHDLCKFAEMGLSIDVLMGIIEDPRDFLDESCKKKIVWYDALCELLNLGFDLDRNSSRALLGSVNELIRIKREELASEEDV